MQEPTTRTLDCPSSDLPLTPFDGYEVHGVKVHTDAHGEWCEQTADDEADFWSIYGHIPGQGLDCIGDFSTRSFAEEIYSRITGKAYQP